MLIPTSHWGCTVWNQIILILLGCFCTYTMCSRQVLVFVWDVLYCDLLLLKGWECFQEQHQAVHAMNSVIHSFSSKHEAVQGYS